MKKNNASLYVGLLLILFGGAFLLDLNGLLPDRFYSEYINLILGAIGVIFFFRTKKSWILAVGVFFLTNGALIWLDHYLPGWNYLAALALFPGVICLTVSLVKRSTMFLIPGAMLTSWGLYILLITARILTGFSVIMGMFFVFTALGFLIIFLCEQEAWAGIPALVMALIGLVIVTIGMGPVARNMLLQIAAVAVVVIGIALVISGMMHKPKEKHRDKDKEE
ncbi:MAG: hypothetical protein ACRCW2_03105 [Cellulosilyticaceae bacterium]